jgi:LPS sulfotransferase NodH
MYRDLRLTPLVLWYEDVLEDPDAAVAAVASHLGVALEPAAAVTIPEIRRQSQAGAEAWLAQHAGRP